jgi:class 3 adenylate cyclase/tetratricopeptide (TPR) repeat protein
VLCPACGAESGEERARFCPACGARLAVPPGPANSRRVVTAVFADLVGSTALGERLDPETLWQVMTRYYSLMRDCLERHGGTVEKFIGDAVMAVFGVPRVHEDDALRAARAAWEMRLALDGLNAELAQSLPAPLRLRIGVNTGEVLSTGALDPGQSMVSGDTVNTAARLEQHAPDGDILLGPDTYRVLAGQVVAEPVEPLTVKGKARPLRAWRLLGLEAPPATPRELTPLVGRRIELARLELAWEQTLATRAPHLFTLFGDAGVGKSRLAGEFVRPAAARGAAVAVARCQPYGDGGTVAVLADVAGQLLGPGPWARTLDRLLNGTPRDQATRALAHALLRGDLDALLPEDFPAAGHLLEAVARERPVVVVLDDLHWAQPTLLDLVDHLMENGGPVRLLVLCVARLELLDLRPQWGGGRLSATAFVVPPLDARDCRALVDAIGEVTLHGDQGAADRVTAMSEGNPLFAEQMAALLADGGSAEELPPTVQALLAARLDRLPAAERDLLGRGAVVGREFTVPALCALNGGDGPPPGPEPYAGPLRALVRRRLIEPTGRQPGLAYRFTHLLVREVVYAGLPKRLRAERHEALADWLERGGGRAPDVVGTHLAEAYHHRRELGTAEPQVRSLGTRAAARLSAAGTASLGRGECSWAADLLERAVRLTDQLTTEGTPADDACETRVRLAEALIAVGDHVRARDLLDRARAEAGDDRIRAHARLQLAHLGTGAGARELARTAADVLPVFTAAGDDLGIARARLHLAHESQRAGRYAEAAASFREALPPARRAGAELEQATALGGLATTLWLGPGAVAQTVEECRHLLPPEGEGRRAARAAVGCPLAVLLAMRRDVAEARELVARSERIVAELGVTAPMGAIHAFAGIVEYLAGSAGVAEERLRAAGELCARAGDADTWTLAGTWLARLWCDRGRLDSALAWFREEPPGGEGGLSLVTLSGREAVRARVLAAVGRHDEAGPPAAEALRLASATDSTSCLAGAWLASARVELARGQRAAAWEAAGTAARLFSAKGHLIGAGWAYRTREEAR